MLRTKQIFSGPNFIALAINKGKLLQSETELSGYWATYCIMHWIVFYPVDSTTHLLNNLGLVKSACKTALKSFFLAPHLCTRILIQTMTGLLKMSSLTCQSG